MSIVPLLSAVALLGAAGDANAKFTEQWVAVWTASQQAVTPDNGGLPPDAMRDATVRQVVRLPITAARLRVRFSNAFGSTPLRIDAATIARSAANATSRIDRATLKPLRFGGAPGVIVPAGADYWSDPVDLRTAAGADVTISIQLPEAPAQQTGHPGSRATSYVVQGDQTGAVELAGATTSVHWFQLSSIEASGTGHAIIAFGDSIIDGNGVQPNTNRRWTDTLQLRFHAAGLRDVAVLNAGIGGNHLLTDGIGPNALARFDRDVLSQPGVTHLIVLEGVNDLGGLSEKGPVPPERHAATVEAVLDAYRQIVARSRAHGIKVIGATITPYGASAYYHPDAASEADRQRINKWIRTPRNFDGVVDFDAALRDPLQPGRLHKPYDGDGLHPSVAGYQAMADAIALDLLR